MFSNLQIRPAKPHRRRPSMAARAGVSKRRVSLVPVGASNNVPSLSFMEGLFGEEFPDAFASASRPLRKTRKSILDLPSELLAVICDHLSKLEIKRLRLTSKKLALAVDLRIDRVYISPNRANLNVLETILEHPRYKHRIRELVWDDAQLDEYSTLDTFRDSINFDEQETVRDIENLLDYATQNDDANEEEDDNPQYRALEEEDFFSADGCLTNLAKGILLRYDDQFSRDIIARNAIAMSIEDSYAYYQQLYQDEQNIIQQGQDVASLHRALRGFPNLRRITLTSEVWRPWNLYPHYDTPYYRSLPPGFRKPYVWPWLSAPPRITPAQRAYRDKIMAEPCTDRLPQEWRGYNVVVPALLKLQQTQIEEFIIDSGNELAGLGVQLFTTQNLLLDESIRTFSVLPLKRLQLTINFFYPYKQPNKSVACMNIKHMLSKLELLEHLDFNPHWCDRRAGTELFGTSFEPNNILPGDLIRRLKTFALRNVLIDRQILYDMIVRMQNAHSITLDNTTMNPPDPYPNPDWNWAELFQALKTHYTQAMIDTRPRFTWLAPFETGDKNHRRCSLLDDELNAFLYTDADCPFDGWNVRYPQQDASGWIVDARDRSFKARAKEWCLANAGLLDQL